MLEVILSSSRAVAARACLREPCARDELVPAAPGPVALTAWLSELVVEGHGSALGKPDVWRMSVADRDRIVALAHLAWFGDRIESAVDCGTCRQAFELSFSLQELLDSTHPASDGAVAGPDARGVYSLADGCQFRLPTPDDERALQELPEVARVPALTQRCLLAGSAPGNDTGAADLERLESAMASVGPVLDLDFPASCALCGVEQSIHFDMVSFFAASLLRERSTLLYELHRLASAYHWSWGELLGLPRSVRRAQAALIEADRRPKRTPA